LEADGGADPDLARPLHHRLGVGQVGAQGPLAVHHLAGVEGGVDRFPVQLDLHGDGDQIDVGFGGELLRVGKRVRDTSASAAAREDSALLFATATSYPGRARRAGTWVRADQLRPGATPTIPTRTGGFAVFVSVMAMAPLLCAPGGCVPTNSPAEEAACR
jgi:hypothetical protein